MALGAWFAIAGVIVVRVSNGFEQAVVDYHYDSQENRNPLLQAIFAGVALVFALATAWLTQRNARLGTPRRLHVLAAAGLTVATLLASVTWILVVLASGPL